MYAEILQATVSTKGQVTLPVSLRQKLGIVPGSKLRFELGPTNTTIVVRPDLPMSAYYGMLKGQGPEADDLIADMKAHRLQDKSADPSRWS